jgi:hypothetical protein
MSYIPQGSSGSAQPDGPVIEGLVAAAVPAALRFEVLRADPCFYQDTARSRHTRHASPWAVVGWPEPRECVARGSRF